MQIPTATAFLFSLLLAVTEAQNLGAEPPCATACLSSAISAAGCKPTDQACQCGPTQSVIATKVEPCLLASCAATQLIAVQSIGEALCAAYSSSMSITMAGNITSSTVSSVGSTTAGSSTVSSVLSGGSFPSTTGHGPTATSSSTGGVAKITGVAYAGAAALGLVGAMVAL